MTVRHVIDTAAPPSREAIQGLVDSITSKIQQGQESICPTELKQLSSLFFHNDAIINSIIPYLNRSLLQSGTIPHDGCVTLVRYRGMVQDVMDTEYYLCEVDGVKTKYREYYSSSSESSSTFPEEVDLKHNLKERQVLVVVPIPFATECIIPRVGEKTTDGGNNVVSANNDIMIMEQQQDKDESQGIGNKKKRPLENSSSSSSNHDVPSTKQHQPNYRDRSPNSVVAANTLNDWWPPACLGSDPNQCPVLAKFYNDNTPKLNQVVDMIGVLSMHPAAVSDDLDGPTLPPPSLLPRLHVLVHKRMDIDLLVGGSNKSATTNTNNANTKMRLLAMETLSKTVFGRDKDTAAAAAEAVLLTLHSLAERDAKGGQPLQMTEDTTLGCASLHLRTQNDKDCNLLWKRLQHALQQLVPVVTTIDLSNPSSLLYKTPCKNNLDSSRLEPSILQLPKGAVVLVKFDDNDYKNNNNNPDFMDALRSLTRSHVIPYKFEGGMVYPFEADVRVFVLSTIHQDCSLSCTMTCHVPTLGNDGTSNTTTSMEDTKQMAHYLASCRCTNNTNIALDKTVLKQAQQDFVNQRAQQRLRGLPEPAEEEFHLWLTMTRLLARSHGKQLATVQHWNEALQLYNAMNNIK